MKFIATISIIIILFTLYPAKIFGQTRAKRIARLAINVAFCHGHGHWNCLRGRQAWNVADCETGHTFNLYATNGQYKGIFQMGYNERQKFGFAWNYWEQARAAKRYYLYSLKYNGYGWEPWSCLPY